MKITVSLLLSVASASEVDTAAPIGKILSTLSECETKVIKEGEEAQKVYAKFSEWCEERNANIGYEVKTATAEAEGLQATIMKETANQQVLSSQIEDFAADIATDEKDLAAATKVRAQENADFKTAEAYLLQVIDALTRAISLIEREMAGGASMMQLKSANSLKQVFSVMVQATAMNTADAQKLTAFVQSSTDDSDFEMGAPAGAVYENQSGGIVDVLNGLLDTANEQLDNGRKQERSSLFNYEKLKQSLEDEIKYANAELSEAKKGLSASRETQATAQGDLDVTQKDLAEDRSTLSQVHQTCMTTSQTFETETKSRSRELKGLAACKVAIGSIGGGGASFLQTSSTEEPLKLAVHLVRNLARKMKDQSLAQLASRMTSTLVIASKTGEDVFAKIKEMTADMIAKLEEEAAADATQKAYCDKEMAETKEKVADKQAELDKHTTRIEQRQSGSAKVNQEVATLQEELAKMTSEQLEMDNLRRKEKADYDFNEAETTQNLDSVKFALKTLRDFYGAYEKEHTGFSSQDGTAAGVIAMIETLESELSVNLVRMTAVEEAAVVEYTAATKTFAEGKLIKEKAIHYKTREAASLDKGASDYSTDREAVQSELDANTEALSKLSEMCVGKAETYDERVARREEEMEGLKNSLKELEDMNSFIQRSAKHLRGVHSHTA